MTRCKTCSFTGCFWPLVWSTIHEFWVWDRYFLPSYEEPFKMPFSTNDSAAEAEDKTAGIKNRFKWSWLTDRTEDERAIGDWYRKQTKRPGYVLCAPCNKELKYSNRGKLILHDHANKNADHRKAMEVSSTYWLPPALWLWTFRNLFFFKECDFKGNYKTRNVFFQMTNSLNIDPCIVTFVRVGHIWWTSWLSMLFFS